MSVIIGAIGDRRMEGSTAVHDGLTRALTKLRTLRDSCVGTFRSRRYPPDFTWFEGAAAICQDAIDRIKETLRLLDKSRK
jgi:hypothetical protein